MGWRGFLSVALWLVAQPASPADRPSAGARYYEPRTFLGYACEDDCGRHKAGYAWAEAHEAASRACCEWLGAAEAEGCEAYVDSRGRAEPAGFQWALENEVSSRRECGGAGARFRAGCERAIEMPAGPAP